MHTISAAVGRNIRVNSPNVADVDVQNTAAKNARRAHGFTTGIGVSRLSNEQGPLLSYHPHHPMLILFILHTARRGAMFQKPDLMNRNDRILLLCKLAFDGIYFGVGASCVLEVKIRLSRLCLFALRKGFLQFDFSVQHSDRL